VKKFNWARFKSLVWFILAALVVLVLWPIRDISISNDIHARRFCAYGALYVEFQQGNTIWGTTFLDDNGRPVRCTDNDIHQPMIGKEVI